MDLNNLPIPSRSNTPIETQDASASTSTTPFAEPPTISAPKSSAQRQRAYRQRIAASRTPAQLLAMRISETERKRNYRLRKAANLALASGSLESTTATSSRSAGRSNYVQNSTQRQLTNQQRQTLAAEPAQTTVQPDCVKKSTEDVAKDQTHLIRTDNKCYECSEDIVGCRYVCVQCAQFDLCGACEACGVHKHHYALRVPPYKPRHEVMAILERIRHIINTELQEVPIDETKSIKCKVDSASDPLAAMVKVEMLDIDEYEPIPQTVDETNIKCEVDSASDPLEAMVKVEMLDIDEYDPVPKTVGETNIKCELDSASDPLEAMVKVEMLDIDEYEPIPQAVDETNIKQEEQGGESSKRQQRRKRRTDTTPVTLADTHTHIAHNQLALLTDTPPVTLADTQTHIAHNQLAHNQLALLTETLSITRTKTKTLSGQVSVPSSSKTIIEQTPRTYEVPIITPPNVITPVMFNQATGSVIPIIMYNIPKTEISDELQPDRVHTSAISSSQAQVVSFDPSQPVLEEIVIKTELPD